MIILQIVALFGMLNSLYIGYHRIIGRRLYCLAGEKCNEVLESKYGRIFRIKNDLLGLIFYVLIFVLGFYTYLEYIKINILFLSLFALTFSSYLIYIQAKKLKNYCSYCILSAIINLIIFILSLKLITS